MWSSIKNFVITCLLGASFCMGLVVGLSTDDALLDWHTAPALVERLELENDQIAFQNEQSKKRTATQVAAEEERTRIETEALIQQHHQQLEADARWDEATIYFAYLFVGITSLGLAVGLALIAYRIALWWMPPEPQWPGLE